MTPPTPFFLPSHVPNTSTLSPSSLPILITSNTPAELITFAIAFVQSIPAAGSFVLITTKDRESLITSLSAGLIASSSSSPLTSTASILASNSITLFFVETLAHLRVLLSSLQHSIVAFLGVDGFIGLHDAAGEMSAQGISRTLAGMVNITSASCGVLVLHETRDSIERSVPMLNPGISGNLSHSTAPILRILGRWVRGFWNQSAIVDGEGSAEWICLGEKWHVRWTCMDGEVDDVQISRQ